MAEDQVGFLKQKYNLHNAPEVKKATQRTEGRTGERVPQNPNSQIQNYLDRFTEILDRKDPEKRHRGIETLKRSLYGKVVIKPDEIPEAYFENQRRIARERGHGDIEIGQDVRFQLTEVIIADQQSSLDTWIDYLTSPDATYPDWLKYWSTRSVVNMGEYDKEKKAFTTRSKGTTKPFPDLNREALAIVLDAVGKKYTGQSPSTTAIGENGQEEFSKLVQNENFAKLYAFAIDKVTPASQEQLTSSEGRWVKYDQGSDHMPLVQSLQGHGTGWCTAGETTAQTQLQNGDFYVYYSNNQEGNPNVPRVAIRMEDESIAEVRGVAHEQNLDPYIGTVVQDKLKEFPDGASYEKQVRDMKLLTEVEQRAIAGQVLSKDDLIFLYEINAAIDGFGYQRDPRIDELRANRNPKEDAPTVFDCKPDQIAWRQEDVGRDTKAYVGPLFSGIFTHAHSIDHIYTAFPEGRIRFRDVVIGGKTSQELEDDLLKSNFKIGEYARDIMRNKDFHTLSNPEDISTVRLKVRDLGFTDRPTTDQLYARAQELGLELCPAETGPHMRLAYKDQPMNEWLNVGMKQIANSNGNPHVFLLGRDDDGLWLHNNWALPGYDWNPSYEFVFSIRK